MLYPTVLIRSQKFSGSGVIISSKKNKAGYYDTYVLTCAHIVKSCITVIDGEELIETCFVNIPRLNRKSKIYGFNSYEAQIVLYGSQNNGKDYAILKLKCDETQIKYVANLQSMKDQDNMMLGEEVWAVNYQFFETNYVITQGILSAKNVVSNGETIEQFLVTCSNYYGASGGAVYIYNDTKNRYDMIGLIAEIASCINNEEQAEEGKEVENSSLIPHLTLVLPLKLIFEWVLEDTDNEDILYIFK